MLLFQPVEIDSTPPQACFPDHANPERLYVLPERLEAASTPDGLPDFMLLRYHGDFTSTEGGLLRMRLRLAAPPEPPEPLRGEAPRQLQPVAFHTCCYRLRLRSLIEGPENGSGQWRPALLMGSELVVPGEHLTAAETQLLQHLLEEHQSAVVEVELAMQYRGLVPGQPWLVTAREADLRGELALALGTEPVRADDVVAVFLTLPERRPDLLRWRSLAEEAPAVTEPPEGQRASLLTEAALHALDAFFDAVPGAADGHPFPPARYALRPGEAGPEATFARDLRVGRLEDRTHQLTWSVTQLYQEAPSEEVRRRLFPVVHAVSPFQPFQVHVVNSLPFDETYLREVSASLRYPGATGVPEHKTIRFDGKTGCLERFQAVRPFNTPFEVAYQITATLAPPEGAGWPVVWKTAWLSTHDPVIEIGPQESQIGFVRVEAEEGVFNHVSLLAVQIAPRHPGEASDPAAEPPVEEAVADIGNAEASEQEETALAAAGAPPEDLAQLTLTRERPAAWVALPGVAPDAALHVRCTAHPPEGVDAAPLALIDGPVENRAVRIAAYQVDVLAPDHVTITLAPEAAAHYAYVAVALSSPEGPEAEESKLYSLQPEEPRVHALFRTSIFAPLRFKYRIHFVAKDEAGNTLPMASTNWTEAEATSLILSPPFQAVD